MPRPLERGKRVATIHGSGQRFARAEPQLTARTAHCTGMARELQRRNQDSISTLCSFQMKSVSLCFLEANCHTKAVSVSCETLRRGPLSHKEQAKYLTCKAQICNSMYNQQFHARFLLFGVRFLSHQAPLCNLLEKEVLDAKREKNRSTPARAPWSVFACALQCRPPANCSLDRHSCLTTLAGSGSAVALVLGVEVWASFLVLLPIDTGDTRCNSSCV